VSFEWPLALLSLLVVPVLLAVYRWALRRRRRQAVRHSNVALLRSLLPRRRRWQRHVPIALLLAALAAVSVAAARPHVELSVADARTSIILAVDVSGSMCSTDVDPNRLAVAQEAARAFVEKQPQGIRMGLVVFAGFAELSVPPTTDREALLTALEILTTGRGTAIGSAILKGLDAIAEVNPAVQPVGDVPEPDFPSFDEPAPPDEPPTAEPAPRPPDGEFEPDIVVLLTDGRNTRGIEPLDAVPYAVERRVRVYTIGFGTENPAPLSCTRDQLGGDFDPSRFGGGGFGGGAGFSGLRGFLVADTPTLTAVAEQTGGKYFGATDADELREVFSDLPKEVTRQKQLTEVTWILAALGALLAAAAVAASVRWSP
jgi:Ca-activated chloride channel family protein